MNFVKDFKKTEDKFKKKIRDLYHHETVTSTEDQDIKEHWDIAVKFDVKTVKKVKREDTQPDENIHWVEILNVNGDSGWLYGKADYFAFELNDYWLIVSKERLQELVKKKCQKTYTDQPSLYHLYKRKGRKDVITLVKTLDLIYIKELMVEKQI